MLIIKMKNESSKHYFCMDLPDYTCFPDEKEILLQSGLIFNLERVVKDPRMNKIYLSSSEKQIRRHKCRRNFIFIIPFAAEWLIQMIELFTEFDKSVFLVLTWQMLTLLFI